MKTTLFILFTSFFTINLLAQQYDTIKTSKWINNSWQLSARNYNTPNIECQVKRNTNQAWDTTSHSWKKDFTTTFYHYNRKNLIDTVIVENWVANKITSESKNTYTYVYLGKYSAGQFLSSVLKQRRYGGSGEWANNYNDEYIYDNNNRLTEKINQYWDNDRFAQEWVDGTKTHYTYNDDGTVNNFWAESWNTLFWTPTYRSTFWYNDMLQPTIELDESWVGNGGNSGYWIKSDSINYQYNSKNQISKYLLQIYTNDKWTNSYKEVYSYNANDSLGLLTFQNWEVNTSTWINSTQQIFGYNDSNKLTELIYRKWDTAGKTWLNNSRDHYIYHTQCTVAHLDSLNFTASENSHNVLLEWNTENIASAPKFIVQRSTNAVSFTNIQTIVTKSSDIKNTYTYNDNISNIEATGKLYYRLQKFDVNGKISFSNVVAVTLKNAIQVFVTPNPAADNFMIVSNSPGKFELNMYDLSGRNVLKRTLINAGGQRINVSTLSGGIYIVKIIIDNNELFTQKLMIKR